jgi:hypothetical protein
MDFHHFFQLLRNELLPFKFLYDFEHQKIIIYKVEAGLAISILYKDVCSPHVKVIHRIKVRPNGCKVESRILPEASFRIEVKVSNFLKQCFDDDRRAQPHRHQKGSILLVALCVHVDAALDQSIQNLKALVVVRGCVYLIGTICFFGIDGA